MEGSSLRPSWRLTRIFWRMKRQPREEESRGMPCEPVMFMKGKQVGEELRGSRCPAGKIKLLKAKRLTTLLIGRNAERIAYAKMQGLPDMFMKASKIQDRLGQNLPLTRYVQEN
jgi:hypothetical protein